MIFNVALQHYYSFSTHNWKKWGGHLWSYATRLVCRNTQLTNFTELSFFSERGAFGLWDGPKFLGWSKGGVNFYVHLPQFLPKYIIQLNSAYNSFKWVKGTSIRKNCIPYQLPKLMKQWCYSWLQPIKTKYEVEAYDLFQVTSWLTTICRHPSDCNSLREEHLQNMDIVYVGQGLYS